MGGKTSPSAYCGAILAFATTGALAQTAPAVLESSHIHDHFATNASLQLPAVSEVNGKVDYAGGNMNSAEGHNFSGSITLPISHQFGFQADALYSRISDLNFYGGAGHLFWRNPTTGLLGLTGGYLYRDGADSVDTFQAGAEGELYWHRFTFGFFGGIGSINYQYSAPFITPIPQGSSGAFPPIIIRLIICASARPSPRLSMTIWPKVKSNTKRPSTDSR